MNSSADLFEDRGLQPTLEEYQLIWENTKDAIFIIREDGAITQANPALTEMLGWRLEEIEGHARPPFFMDSFTLKDHHKTLDALRRGRSIANYETQRKHKDGTIKDVLASYRAVNKDHTLAVAMYKDITEEKIIQHRLGVAESCYEALVEYSPDAILVQSGDEITFVNSAAIQLLGAENYQEIIGHSVVDFIEMGDAESRRHEFSRKLGTMKPEPVIEKLKRVNGTSIWVEIIAISVEHDGETVIQAILRDVTVRKYYEDQLTYMATYDPMTGVANRNSFIESFDRAIKQAQASGETLAVLYADLDKFKEINDSFGHGVGDELLIQFAKRLVMNVRDVDIVGRIGGDEFLVLLRNSPKEKVETVVQRMHAHVIEPYMIQSNEIHSSSSIGIAMYPHDGANSATLIANADQALYKAKEKRNQFVFYCD